MLETATCVAGTSWLLTTPSWRWRVVVGIGAVSQGVGVVMSFATLAVKALLEQAHFGFEGGDALVELGLKLLDTGVEIGAALGELLLEFGLTPPSALVEGLVEMGVPTSISEDELASGQAARGCGRDRMEKRSLHGR